MLPDPVYQHLKRKLTPAWLHADGDGRLVEAGGALAEYGLDTLRKGDAVADHVDALNGSLEADEELKLESVALRPDVYADLHILPADHGTWVLFVDATESTRQRRQLQQRANEASVVSDNLDRLLGSVMPDSMTERLKAGETRIADEYDAVTLVHSNIVEFGRVTRAMRPADVALLLARVVLTFDELARQHGLQKIKTLGDTYLAGAGLPEPRPDHAAAAVEMALDMQEAIAGFNAPDGAPLELRVAVHSGPVVAGVNGRRGLGYDVWGETAAVVRGMNVAAGVIEATATTRALLGDGYRFAGNRLVLGLL